jgi:hypothetical protein
MRRGHFRFADRSLLPKTDRGVLIALLVAGALLRLAMMLAIRPISYGSNDSGTYLAAASGAGGSLFYDLHHAVGYSIFLDIVAPIVQDGVRLALLQHLLGLGAGALLFLAGRNFGAPRWAAAIGAGAYVLNIDIVAYEHSILSEAAYLPLIPLFVFAASRLYVVGRLKSVMLWAAILGLAGAVAYTMRYPGAALFVVAVPCALVLVRGTVRMRAAAAASAAIAVGVVLGCYLTAQDSETGIGWELFPGRGWSAYATIAPNADCSQFTPPPGTRVLCESSKERAGKTPEFYSWDGRSPARRLEPRGFPYSDEKFAAFADAASTAGDDRGTDGGGPLSGIESRVLKVWRNAGVVFGPIGWGAELDYRNPLVEEGERGLAGDLLTLTPMSFHSPLQPLKDLRPFLRLSGPFALLSLLIVFAALPRLGLARALFCLGAVGVMLAWIDAGNLPRYALPVYVLSVALFPIAAAGLMSQRPPAAGAIGDGAPARATSNGARSQVGVP